VVVSSSQGLHDTNKHHTGKDKEMGAKKKILKRVKNIVTRGKKKREGGVEINIREDKSGKGLKKKKR